MPIYNKEHGENFILEGGEKKIIVERNGYIEFDISDIITEISAMKINGRMKLHVKEYETSKRDPHGARLKIIHSDKEKGAVDVLSSKDIKYDDIIRDKDKYGVGLDRVDEDIVKLAAGFAVYAREDIIRYAFNPTATGAKEHLQQRGDHFMNVINSKKHSPKELADLEWERRNKKK